MSTEQKNRFDAYFKIFIGIAVMFFGWLGSRTVDKFDLVEKDIHQMKVSQEKLTTDIEWIKKALK